MSEDNFNQFEQSAPDNESEEPIFLRGNYKGDTREQPILDFLKRTICPFFTFQSFSFIIIILYIIVFIISLIPHGINEWKKKYHFLPPSIETLSDFDLDGSKIREKFYKAYRWITAGFLHGDFSHLFSNCFSILILGTIMEYLIGTWRFIAIYFLSGILGGLFKLLVDHEKASVGASICICGIISASIGYCILNWRDLPKICGCQNRYCILIIPILIAMMNIPNIKDEYEYKEDEKDEKENDIDAYGHIGGLIFGFFLSFIFIKPKDEGSVAFLTAQILFISGIVICCIFALAGYLCFYLMDKYKENK